jgi:hypothetical protein
VPRGVDQVEPVAGPVAADGRGEDGDATVALLGVEVGDGRARVHLAALVRGAGDVQDPFGQGGLAGIDVRQDAEIADPHGGVPSIDPFGDGAHPTAGEQRSGTSSTGGAAGAGHGGHEDQLEERRGDHDGGAVKHGGLLPVAMFRSE